jgi:hypothetical protein
VLNATLAQLDRADEMEDYGAPFATSRASHRCTPALWVGVVGHDAIWPVRFQVENGVENLYAPQMFRSGRPEMELVNFVSAFPDSVSRHLPWMCDSCRRHTAA